MSFIAPWLIDEYQAPSEEQELYEDLLGILPFAEYDEKQIKEMAQILYTQGYRKPSKE